MSTTEAQIEQTKEIAAPESGEQDALEPSQTPQLEPDETKEMTEDLSFTASEETEETEQIEDPSEPDTKHPVPIRITFQDREQSHHTRNRQGEISLNYHSVRCSICNHPDREAIEQGYLHWENPTYLTHEYGLGRRRAVYRHAQALGLRRKRGERTRRSLEFVMEQAESTTATASDVIRAVRAYSCVSEDGQWTEPTKRVIITHEHVDRVAIAQHGDACLPDRQASSAQDDDAEEVSGALPASNLKRLTSRIDGHARPSKNAATPASSTKLRKLMGTLLTSFGTKRR